jgi:hypothetical protein
MHTPRPEFASKTRFSRASTERNGQLASGLPEDKCVLSLPQNQQVALERYT